MKQERLNSRFLKVLPMSAEESGNGGRNLNIAYSFTETPFGEILMLLPLRESVIWLLLLKAGMLYWMN